MFRGRIWYVGMIPDEEGEFLILLIACVVRIWLWSVRRV